VLAPTLDDVKTKGLLGDIGTVWLTGATIPTSLESPSPSSPSPTTSSPRSASALPASPSVSPADGAPLASRGHQLWLSNFDQLRRNTDRRTVHRLTQFALAVVFLRSAKLIDWRNQWSPGCVPIR